MVGSKQLIPFALLAFLMQALDLLTALRMVVASGIQSEMNPLMREVLLTGGAGQLAALKITAVALSVGAILVLAYLGRTRLARICLLLAADLGALGVLSNGGLRFVLVS